MGETADRLAGLSPEKRLLLQKILQEKARGSGPPPVRRRSGGGPVPLSFAQRRLWLAEQAAPGSVAYSLPLPLRLRGRLDARALALALGELVRRHEALRTVFAELGGEPVQRVLPPAPVPLPVADLAGLAADDRERALLRVATAAGGQPFDLERGPLLRALRVRLAADDQALFFNMHHIVSDEWSMGIMVREMAELYDAFAAGRAPALPEPGVQYPDFTLWQREHLGGAALEAQLAFWRERLAGAPPLLDLPTDRPRTATAGAAGGRRSRYFAADTAGAVRALAQGEGATLFMVMLAAWQLLLARHAGTEDVLVGTPVAGRTRPEVEGTLGFFVNTLAMRADLSGDPTVRELLARTRESVLAAHANQDLPFDQLVDELQPERVPGRTPLFQVMFSFQRLTEQDVRLGDVEVHPISPAEDAVRFDLSMTASDREGELAGTIAFRGALFDGATAERMLARYERLLAAMAAAPDRRVSEIDLLGPDERARLLAEGRGPAADPDPRPVHERFAEQAARTPGAPAVVFPGGAWSYAELDRRSAALAVRLRALGVGPDARAGVLLERGPELVAAVLGVLRAGGAYLPLDPEYPAERLSLMLRDSGAAAVVAGPGLAERVEGFGGAVVPVGGDPGDADALSHSRTFALPHPPSPDNLAYVIYTSGSTGAPKGVLATHRGLSTYLAWFDGAVLGPEGFALPLVSRPGFDAHVRQLFPPLLRGEAVWVLPEATVADPAALLRALAGRERVSFGGVPSLWSAMLDLVRSGEAPRPAGLRAVLLGGEALPPELAERTFAEFPGVALWNHYGPTEATVNTTAARVRPGEPFGIGRPVAGARVYLLDPRGAPVPPGVPGELHAGGAGVARGYLGRADLTAERFVPDPFAGEPGARMYRSGDRVRRRADGELEWLGRTDAQLKVRGFRVEPGEVEAALAAHPRVREAAVAARDARLVGYVVAEGGAAPPAAELRAWLAGRLPGHMVPDVVVALDAMPRTSSGKTDRRALPAPEGPAADGYVAPRTPTEEIVAAIWAEVLGIERVGAGDDFFALGGQSLLATRVVTRIRLATGADLPLRAMFEAATPAALAGRVDALLRAGAGLVPPPIEPAPRDGPLPLSYAQQRLWFIQRMEPESAAYNLPFPLRLRGALDPRTLRRALTEVARRHETLRTVLRDAGGEPEQVVLPPAPFHLPAVDLAGLAPEQREREALRVAAEEMLRPFDLGRGPLLRARLVRLEGAEWLLLGTIHHVVSDGWSIGVLTREVSALHDAFARGAPSPLPPLPLQYADFAVWQRGWLRGETLERQVDFWREKLRGAPPLLDLPTDRPRPALPDLAGGDFRFALPPAEVDALRGLARREGATAFVVLLAAFQALLARSGAGDDVPVGTSAAGRTRLELEPLIGFFVNTLVLRGDLSGAPTGRELLRRVRETLLEAHAHQDLPFERVVAGLRPERSLSYNPLFQVFLAMVNVDSGELRLGDAETSGVRTGAYTAQFELALAVSDQRGHMLPALNYRRELFDESTIERLAARLRRLVAGMAADPGLRVGEIDLLAPGERRAVLAASRGADAGPPPETTLHALFAAAAERTPDAVAVEREGGGSLTYAELRARSGRVARLLAARGAGPETAVGVCMEWSPEMVAAVLGVLGAGAVYLPLDPENPAERLAGVLGDAGARLLLADASTAGRVPDGPWETLLPDAERERAGVAADPPAPAPAFPDSAAYAVYTSGSTGTPRGVVVEHRAIAAHSAAFAELAGLGAGDRVLQFASAGFDVSLEQLLPTLLAGATLVLRGPEPWSPESFRERARALGITVANLPVAYWQAAAEDGAGEEEAPALRVVVVGGEAVPSAAVRRWRERVRAPHRLLDGYGPTEAVVTATAHELPADFPGAYPWPVAPIGRPLPGRAAYVLDDAGGLAADGVPGELYLGGASLARGYLGRPGATAERWLPDPFAPGPGARMYRTGDRVRRGPGGALEWMGRTDRQLKVRGFRIEPGEVEAALLRHPGVREAAVAAAGGPGGARLAAYLVPAAGLAVPGAAELRGWLRASLPEHMVPAAFVALEALPLTRSGKLDRGALPAPDAEAGAGEHVAPRTPDEARLAAIFAEVLGLETVGVHDHFFDLGGHSLLATRVVARVHRELGVEVPVRAMFEAPTVAALAARLEAVRPAAALEEWELDEEWERLAGLSDEEVERLLGGG